MVLWNQANDRWASEICESDIPSINAKELDDFLDLDAFAEAHDVNQEILYPPLNLAPFISKDLKLGKRLHSFVSVPLASYGKMKGMLNVFSFSPGK